ncbi:MAG: HAD-IIIA family hydrolase, partial [Massilia sp.]|nr:HAD-IIIA family hydrolase [Massilia sp.]
MSNRAIFLDKDGTLVENLHYNADPLRMTLCSGMGAALHLLARLDYRFFVISNQDGVAHDYFSEVELASVSDRLTDQLFREQLTLEGFYYCPHHPNGKLESYAVEFMCRKPMPGMLVRAAREHGIDLQASWML